MQIVIDRGLSVSMRQELVDSVCQLVGSFDGQVVPWEATLQHEPVVTTVPDEANPPVGSDVVFVPAPEGLGSVELRLDDVTARQ